jgi:hypothetical protein
MPHANAYDLEVFKTQKEVEVKKESETTTTEIWAPETGKRFRLAGFNIYLSAASILTLEDETTAFFIIQVPITTNVTVVLPQGGYMSVKNGNKLKYKSLNTAKVTSAFYGIEDIA